MSLTFPVVGLSHFTHHRRPHHQPPSSVPRIPPTHYHTYTTKSVSLTTTISSLHLHPTHGSRSTRSGKCDTAGCFNVSPKLEPFILYYFTSSKFVTFFSLSLIGTLVENLLTSSYSLFNLSGTLFQYYWFRLFHTSIPSFNQIFTILKTPSNYALFNLFHAPPFTEIIPNYLFLRILSHKNRFLLG